MKCTFILLALASTISLFSQNRDQSTTSNINVVPVGSSTALDTVVVTTPADTFVIVLSEIMSFILPGQGVNIIPPVLETPGKLPYTETTKVENIPFSHLSVSLRLNTLGIGVEASTPLSDKFYLRAGMDVFPISIGYNTLDLDSELNKIEHAFGYIPRYRAKGKINFFNGHVLADFYPNKTGIFHITAGFFVGSNKVELHGYLADSHNNPAELLPGYNWPVLTYRNQTIDLTGGLLDFDLKMGNVIKPYLGIGLGKAATKSRFGFKFEAGIVYQVDYTLKQNGLKFDFEQAIVTDVKDIDDYTQWLKLWPMINFQLTYRIF